MYYIFGTTRDGKVELDEPVAWADGTRVQVLVHAGYEYASCPDDGPPTAAELERLQRIDDELGPDEPMSQEEADDLQAAIDSVVAERKYDLVRPPHVNGAVEPAAARQRCGRTGRNGRGAVMRRFFLLDTGVAGLYLRRNPNVMIRAERARARGDRVGICVPGLAELAVGIARSNNPERNRELFHRRFSGVPVWPLTEDAAWTFGRLRADTIRRGREIPRMDLLIAGIALTLPRCTLVTRDGDFRRIPELSLEDWSLPLS